MISPSSSRTTSQVGPPSPSSRARRKSSAPARSTITSRRPDTGSAACGSHLTQSHSARPAGVVRTATRRSAGPAWVAAWQTRLRATASTAVRSPTSPTGPSSGSTGTGTSCSRISSSSRSTSAGRGPASSSGGAHRRLPVPATRRRKSSCAGRRSHRRTLGASARRRASAGSTSVARRRAPSAARVASSSARNCSSASPRLLRARRACLRFRRRPSSQLPSTITGLSRANSAKRASPRTPTITPASARGATNDTRLNGGAGPRAGSAAGQRSGPGSAGAAGRGGRLKVTVPADPPAAAPCAPRSSAGARSSGGT